SEPWSSMRRGQKTARKTTLRSERRSALKKYLTGPTLLEMYDYRVNQKLSQSNWREALHGMKQVL
ncbi:MAG: hypothetical protein WAN12_01575, partial [Candidatus Acidiferrum sp.]